MNFLKNFNLDILEVFFLPKTVEEFQEIYAKLVTKMSQRQ